MTVWIGLALVSLCILAVHVMLQTNQMSKTQRMSKQAFEKKYLAPKREMPAVTREAIRWAAQRTLDRGKWLSWQLQAMDDWERRCMCPQRFN